MIQQNSPALLSMMNSVRPGIGNMNTAPAYMPVPFQSPYPSPWEMAQQTGFYQAPYPQMAPAPGTVTKMNMGGVRVELEYKPEYPTPGSQMEGPVYGIGSPASVPPRQGRAFDIPQAAPGYSEHLKARQQAINNGIVPPYPIVGARSTFSHEGNKLVIRPRRSGIVGRVDYYDGEPVHPHIETGWYGSESHPFYKTATVDPMDYGTQPQYVNPWIQQQRANTLRVTPEQQDLANLAAYYGFSYDDWIHNGSSIYQTMSRACSRRLGVSQKETEIRASHWKVRYPGEFDEDDNSLFYPPGSFTQNGQLTDEYLQTFSVDQERLERSRKQLKLEIVSVNKEGEIINRVSGRSKQTSINERTRKRMFINSIERCDAYNNQLKMYRKQICLQMYQQAPERTLDKSNSNVFNLIGETLTKARQQELMETYRYQSSIRAAQSFNHATSHNNIMDFYKRAKANREAVRRKEWSDLIDKVVPDSELPRIKAEVEKLQYDGKPYIEDGDWVIAKPGMDIVGLPLDVSVNKIIRMNCVTGEEEIYNPDKPIGGLVREQIEQSVRNPNFTEIDKTVDERLSKFKGTHWQS